MQLPNFDSEDRFALSITGGIHIALVVFFLLYTFSIEANQRPSFIEVEFGEFQSGTPTEYAEQQAEQVETRPNPSETEPENPEPENPDPVEEQESTTEETTKPVDVPDQTEEVQEEEVKTPETDKVDPQEESSTEEQKEVTVPPKTVEDDVQQQGAETSGDEEGNTGENNADQGTGNEQEKSAPYKIEWQGDLNRSTEIAPKPQNISGNEATITIRFEVKPDGTVGRIIPIKKSGNPELEREVMSTLRNWRFSRLPSGVPQQNQVGTITFRFVLE